jgi:3-oxoacyl-[acyl-carrier protein] reductase
MAGKVALVTGGSRGLGRWISIALAEKGAAVAVNYAQNIEMAEETVKMIDSLGGKAAAFQADITQETEVKRLIADVEKHFDTSIDILVNNATGPQPLCSIEESCWDHYENQLRFFVMAPFLLVQAVLPGMKEKGEGSIVNIGSEAALKGPANNAHYAAAKSAMIGMTRSWANALGPYGIRVNLVSPGFIPVERHSDMISSGFERQQTRLALKRMGKPQEIGSAVAFLASSEASFITGQMLSVNGGRII